MIIDLDEKRRKYGKPAVTRVSTPSPQAKTLTGLIQGQTLGTLSLTHLLLWTEFARCWFGVNNCLVGYHRSAEGDALYLVPCNKDVTGAVAYMSRLPYYWRSFLPGAVVENGAKVSLESAVSAAQAVMGLKAISIKIVRKFPRNAELKPIGA